MASFVLVHGSGQNATCWSRVGEILTSRGHAVAAPDLPKKASGWRLADYAAEIARSIAAPDTVVVGHSLSGVFLPWVARERACGLLVFLAAVVPEAGKSVRDQFRADPTMFCPGWIDAVPRWFDPAQVESVANEFLFHDCDSAALPAALRTVESFETREILNEAASFGEWPRVPAACIVATDDRTLSPDWIRRASRRVLRQDAIEIRAGHCPQTSRPEATADLLEELAASRIGGQPISERQPE